VIVVGGEREAETLIRQMRVAARLNERVFSENWKKKPSPEFRPFINDAESMRSCMYVVVKYVH
jgi:hypothetical protein